MDYLPLNFAIMRHPSNWLTVLLMALIAGFVLDLILTWHRSNNPAAR